MERNLPKMATTTFDVLVVGGGITGATIAWDAALRGLEVGLVEKKDFACGTSSSTSKLIHGGLRYLQQWDFALVREALKERLTMMTITPHQVTPLPFLAPAYQWGGDWGMISLGLGTLGYNTLSVGKTTAPLPDKELPRARMVGPKALCGREPALDRPALAGGMVYYDAQMYDTARHTLEFILSAAHRGAQVANYTEMEDFLVETTPDGRRSVEGVRVRDRLSDDTYRLRARVTVNASGPWADSLPGHLDRLSRQHIVRSKGIHLITRPLTDGHALTLKTPGGEHLFILPWRGRSLVGTTDTPYEGSPDDPLVTEADLRMLIDALNGAYPPARLKREEVEHFYGGLRPLVSSGPSTGDTYAASRRYEIYDYDREGIEGLFSALGGKYTTSRNLAEKLVDRVARRLDRRVPASATRHVPTLGGATGPLDTFIEQMREHYPDCSPSTVEHLARSYGTRILEVLDEAVAPRPLGPRTPDVEAQVRLAARAEMAFTLEDVVLRRTGMGTLGPPGRDVLQKTAAIMADEHGWPDARIGQEIQQVQRAYCTADALAENAPSESPVPR